jgi:hypothetical protein
VQGGHDGRVLPCGPALPASRPWWLEAQELFFFRANGGLHRARVLDASRAFRVGPAEPLLPPRYYGSLSGAIVARSYDVSTDGQRFLMLKSAGDDADAQAQDLYLVQHWATHLGSGAAPPR